MAEVVIEHKVKDFDRWLPVFRDHERARRRYGCEGAVVQRAVDDPQDVVLRMRWSDERGLREFLASQDLRDAMERAGVVGDPRVTILGDPVPWLR